MARRSKKSQSVHDAKVLEIAKDFEAKGYEVMADISGYKRPGTLGGVRPDVVAKKGTERKIVEVETSESNDSARDRKQQQEFRAAAKRSKNTTFRRVVVDSEDD